MRMVLLSGFAVLGRDCSNWSAGLFRLDDILGVLERRQ